MRPKSLILLVLALGCGLVAAIGVSQLMANRDSSGFDAAVDRETVCIVSQEISSGTLISAEMIKLERWPTDVIPPRAVRNVEDVLDQRAKTTLLVGQLIQEDHLGAGGAAPEIQLGKRLIPVLVDEVKGVAQMIQPGDHVDVLVLLEQGRDFNETSVTTILQNVTVFAVGSQYTSENTEPGRTTRAKTVTLELTPKETQIVALASEKGRLRLVLRHPNDSRVLDIGRVIPDSLENPNSGEAAEPDPVVSMLAGTLADLVARAQTFANPDVHSVCIVTQSIGMGETISADKITLERRPGSTLPAGAIRNLEDVIGCRARGNMFRGELVLENKLLDYQGGTVPLQITPGNRAIPIEVTEASGLAYMLHPGDHVDVYLFVRTEGKTEAGEKVENMHVATILENVIVFAVGDTHTIETGEEGKTIQVKTVTLELSPEDTQLIALASGMARDNKGSLQLSLRHPEDDKQEELPPINFAWEFRGMFDGEEKEDDPFQPVEPVEPVEPAESMVALAPTDVEISGWRVLEVDYQGVEISNKVFPDPVEQVTTPTEPGEDEASAGQPSGSFWNWVRRLAPHGGADADDNGGEDQDEAEITPSEDQGESPPDATIDLRLGARRGVDRG